MDGGGGERVVRGEALVRDDVAVLHVADQDLDAGGEGSHKGAQTVQLATDALAQAVVDEQRDLSVGGGHRLPRAERLLAVVDRNRQGGGAGRRRGFGIDVDQRLRGNKALLLGVRGEARSLGRRQKEGGGEWSGHGVRLDPNSPPTVALLICMCRK